MTINMTPKNRLIAATVIGLAFLLVSCSPPAQQKPSPRYATPSTYGAAPVVVDIDIEKPKKKRSYYEKKRSKAKAKAAKRSRSRR